MHGPVFGNVHSQAGWQWLLEVSGSCWMKLVAKKMLQQKPPTDCFGCQQISHVCLQMLQLPIEWQ